MFDTHKPNPLLAQVPLTVSPFLSLPSAVTLPYSFCHEVPSSLPPSAIDEASDKPKYIISSSGHTAHPDDIINSSNALQQHITKTADDAKKQIEAWEQGIKDRELAEKRRVAPGWLDREEKILEPTKVAASKQEPDQASTPAPSPSREGEEIDRAFGNLAVK
ncbi:hypothetical protein DV736_g5514, partial [Chaetothyriales sp. CBS 134916]